jgi:hypothetical protein
MIAITIPDIQNAVMPGSFSSVMEVSPIHVEEAPSQGQTPSGPGLPQPSEDSRLLIQAGSPPLACPYIQKGLLKFFKTGQGKPDSRKP